MLGPLASHPAGKVLARLHHHLESGNATAAATLFTRDARHGIHRGRPEIAAYYRDLLGEANARRVDLRVLRMARDGEDWDIEADLEIEVERDDLARIVQRGRAQLRLEGRGGSLAIALLEP